MPTYRAIVNIVAVSEANWTDWCNDDTDDGISGPGASGNTETLYITDTSQRRARARLDHILKRGMVVEEFTLDPNARARRSGDDHAIDRALKDLRQAGY